MMLQASTRLRATNVTYDDYVRVVSSLGQVRASEIIPSVLQGLRADLNEILDSLKEAGVGIQDVIRAFKEHSVFQLLKGVGFSLGKLTKALLQASSLFSNAMYRAIEALVDEVGNSETWKALKVTERVQLMDKVIAEHPILAKLTGPVVAGLLLWIWLHEAFTGRIDRDLDIVDTIVDCLQGHFSIKELFFSTSGAYALGCVMFGVATGGLGLTKYGFTKIAHGLEWLGSHSGTVYNLGLALFYTACKYLHIKVRNVLPKELVSHRTHDWFHRLTPEQKAKYRKKFPGTKFHNPFPYPTNMMIHAKARLSASGTFLPSQLVMLDCEMTGLDPRNDEVIQVAALKLELLHGQYKVVDEFNEFIHTNKQPESEFALDHMVEVYKQANASHTNYKDLRAKLHTWLGDWVGKVSPCGDCVPTDTLFLWCKDVIDLSRYDGDTPVPGTFHYEFFDMHSLKCVARERAGGKIDKKAPRIPGDHDALVDCKNQLSELNFILSYLLR